MDSFFGKNGTLQGLMDFANLYQGAKSSSSVKRTNSLYGLVDTVLNLLGLNVFGKLL